MQVQEDLLQSLLKQYFGFTSFRPFQREIMRDFLAGRDVVALLPTGGGKSLCFQLPALARPGLTIVVSPLIALMKDQVDALRAAGVPATFLNSSIDSAEGRSRLRGLHNGEYRLLYVAPERLLLSGFIEDLRRWNVNSFAIDEAHCISEWGHDFRPEYRQIASLRDKFPAIPMMALTATATSRVRDDIINQLHLQNPASYQASFNRPNLTYRVSPKSGAYEQALKFIESREKESGIIYCQSRKSAENVAAKLVADGIKAAPYHAGLESGQRGRAQEAFLRDQVRVICATIAFGMGINKPNVRYVIHYDLPKNVEGYYQETGRAGRDGLPSECLLLFSPSDRIKYSQFIDEKPDPKEREIARSQLESIVHYAESAACRRKFLLDYFGESMPDENCGGCDNCHAPRETWDGTLAAQKLLSCVYRIQEKGSFSVGMAHVVEVLTGAATEKIRKWGHDTLSTYGIGKEHNRADWGAIGRELVRLGFLRQNADRFNVLELTPDGRAALKTRQKITLTRPMKAPVQTKDRAGDIECDELLFEKLRQLRKRLAEERDVPSYIIFSDVALRQMARNYPQTQAEFARISGVGEKKLAEFSEVFTYEVVAHLGSNPKRSFTESRLPASAEPKYKILSSTVQQSVALLNSGKTIAQIASARGFVPNTIYTHIAEAIEAGQPVNAGALLDSNARREIEAAFQKFGYANLSGAVDSLGGRYGYGELRIFRALAQTKPRDLPN
ncbi:MAG: recQ 1 [Verrucomicrobiales bacterium]|nr:recQ 1 [Verrucomicrobiales bacterium]